MATTGGDISQGIRSTEPVYEGTFTRTDVLTTKGWVEKGGTYAAPIVKDRVEEGNAYVKEYTSFADNAVQTVADNENGDQIVGRVVSIDKNIPSVSTNGGTQAATLANVRRATIERFKKGQVITIHVNATTPIVIGDKVSLESGSQHIFEQDNNNGAFYCLEAIASGADVITRARVI